MSITKASMLDTSSLAPVASRREHDHDSHSHVVQFYSEDRSLIETLGHFIGSALEAGDAAIVVATEAHRQGLTEELKARGIDVSSAIEQGRYVPLDAVETTTQIMLDGWPDEARFADHIGGVISRARHAAETARRSN